ncbi:hypothetical protein LDJ79_14895 [Vibrio tritonius]|uniref:Lysozyme inhibitor LprI N-terminal domain-containing protein n=1 Tax=Vibrio tritonius TaxID=1435069 RepID=A0ABS7YT63_9VIBR|nr:hypothetical protein [Vibrio tritonius]MCA2017409.1 hypothetical protein [Vibrio tritonius]
MTNKKRFTPIKTICCALLFIAPLSAHSLSWQQYLEQQKDEAKINLEMKIEQCNKNRGYLNKIEDDWFISLTKEQKYAAASYLEYMATSTCYGEELKEYNSALVAYSAYDKTGKELKQWIDFIRFKPQQKLGKAFDTLDTRPLTKWFSKQPIVLPFDKQEFLKQYAEFQ